MKKLYAILFIVALGVAIAPQAFAQMPAEQAVWTLNGNNSNDNNSRSSSDSTPREVILLRISCMIDCPVIFGFFPDARHPSGPSDPSGIPVVPRYSGSILQPPPGLRSLRYSALVLQPPRNPTPPSVFGPGSSVSPPRDSGPGQRDRRSTLSSNEAHCSSVMYCETEKAARCSASFFESPAPWPTSMSSISTVL